MNSRFVPTAGEHTRLRAGVMKALRYGRINAITGNELARSLREPDDRRIRVVIRNLIREGVPVASSVVPPYGYYICANVDEAAAYIRVLKERIREDSLRLCYFQAAIKDMDVPEQLTLLSGGMS